MPCRASADRHRAGRLPRGRAVYRTLRSAVGVLLVVLSGVRAEPLGQVKSVQGIVMRTGTEGTVPATVGLLLDAGDILTTQAHSTCGLTLRDASRFALGPRSTLVLEQLTWDAQAQTGTSQARVTQGTVVITTGGIAASGPQAMQVTTPRTVVSVRGTTIAVEVRR